MDNKVIIPAIAKVIIQIPKFQLNIFDPSKFPIGNRLNTAKKLLIEYPIAQTMNINAEVEEWNAEG